MVHMETDAVTYNNLLQRHSLTQSGGKNLGEKTGQTRQTVLRCLIRA